MTTLMTGAESQHDYQLQGVVTFMVAHQDEGSFCLLVENPLSVLLFKALRMNGTMAALCLTKHQYARRHADARSASFT